MRWRRRRRPMKDLVKKEKKKARKCSAVTVDASCRTRVDQDGVDSASAVGKRANDNRRLVICHQPSDEPNALICSTCGPLNAFALCTGPTVLRISVSSSSHSGAARGKMTSNGIHVKASVLLKRPEPEIFTGRSIALARVLSKMTRHDNVPFWAIRARYRLISYCGKVNDR